MSFRRAIASLIYPELEDLEHRNRWLLGELSYNARWLSEFPFVMKVLDNITGNYHNYFREYLDPPLGDSIQEISRFRESLRDSADMELKRYETMRQWVR